MNLGNDDHPTQESPWKLENQFLKYFQDKQCQKDGDMLIN